jgi:hypothetical protein
MRRQGPPRATSARPDTESSSAIAVFVVGKSAGRNRLGALPIVSIEETDSNVHPDFR